MISTARRMGRVVAQPHAPACVLVPGGDDGCGALGMEGAAERSDIGALVLGCPGRESQCGAVEHDGTDQPMLGAAALRYAGEYPVCLEFAAYCGVRHCVTVGRSSR